MRVVLIPMRWLCVLLVWHAACREIFCSLCSDLPTMSMPAASLPRRVQPAMQNLPPGNVPQVVGALDSYFLANYLSSGEADRTMWQVDGFVDYLPRTDPRLQFTIFGQQHSFPRDKAFYGRVREQNGQRVEPFYKYAKDTPPVQNWANSILESIADGLEQTQGQHCNHLVVNQYQDGSDHIGFHHDKSATFYPNSSVLTLSLGGERTLRLLCMEGEDAGTTQDLVLTHGSLFVLGPNTNAKWKHSIVKEAAATHRRVSLTYRHINQERRAAIMDLTEEQEAETCVGSSTAAAATPSLDGSAVYFLARQPATQHAHKQPQALACDSRM